MEAWDFTQPGSKFERISGLPRRWRQGRIFLIPTPTKDGLLMGSEKDMYEFVCDSSSSSNSRISETKADEPYVETRSEIVSGGSGVNCVWEKKKQGLKTKRLDGVAIELGPDFECDLEETNLETVVEEEPNLETVVEEIFPETNVEIFPKTNVETVFETNVETVLENTTPYFEERGQLIPESN